MGKQQTEKEPNEDELEVTNYDELEEGYQGYQLWSAIRYFFNKIGDEETVKMISSMLGEIKDNGKKK